MYNNLTVSKRIDVITHPIVGYFDSTPNNVFVHHYHSFGNIHFCNIPKCASVSVGKMLAGLAIRLTPAVLPDHPITICIIRDPTKRIRSAIWQAVQVSDYKTTPESVVEDLRRSKSTCMEGIKHLFPQTFFINNRPESHKNITHYMLVEKLDEDLAILGNNWTLDLSTSHLNSSSITKKQKTKIDKVIQDNWSFFQEYYKEDYELYDKVLKSRG